MTVDADQIERELYRDNLGKTSLMVPRYTPTNWWEIDLLAITNSGYAREYEIKTSLPDFRRDFEKGDKHRRLAEGKCFPSYFWFVCPEGMIPLAEIPDYAGLMYAGRWLKIIKKAPRLQRDKVPEKVISHIARVMTFRFWNCRMQVIQLLQEKNKNKPKVTEKQKLLKRWENRRQDIWNIEKQLDNYAATIRRYFSKEIRDKRSRDYARLSVKDLRETTKLYKRKLELQAADRLKLAKLGISGFGFW